MKNKDLTLRGAWLLGLSITMLFAQPATAVVRIFACEPEWASLAKELGRDAVSVYQASTAFQDPHRIEARPSLVASVRRADLVICTGAELEAAWLPVLLQTAGNRRVLPGSNGYLAAADFVTRLEVRSAVDRAEGDVHPGGNPHIHLDPHNIARVARAVSERLAEIDAANAESYGTWAEDFQARWSAAVARWEASAAGLRGMRIVAYHKDVTYLSAWLGLVEVRMIEPKPGLPPTTAHLAEIVGYLLQQPADAIVRFAFEDPKPVDWLASRTGIPLLVLPYTVGGNDRAADLFGLFEDMLRILTSARH